MTKKIAFLFLINDRINHEDIWKEFFLQDKQNRHSIYIHYKYKIISKHFEKYKLNNCIKTEWGHISLVKAQNLLLESAMQDPDNEMFIFCSGSCVPFKSFDYVHKFFDTRFSYFTVCNDSECFPRCNSALRYVPKEVMKKSYQWCVLNKKHTKLLTEQTEYLKWFEKTIGDEHCYITYLNYKDLDKELIKVFSREKSEKSLTFANWASRDYPYKKDVAVDDNHPKNYKIISKDEIYYLYRARCLFGRKFAPECDLSYLKNLLRLKMKDPLIENQLTQFNDSTKNSITNPNNIPIRTLPKKPIIKSTEKSIRSFRPTNGIVPANAKLVRNPTNPYRKTQVKSLTPLTQVKPLTINNTQTKSNRLYGTSHGNSNLNVQKIPASITFMQ